MPVTQAQADALKKYIAQGEIYLAVGKPSASFAPILFGAGADARKPLKADTVTVADSAGLTSGPATLEYKPEFGGVEIEQAYGEVAPRLKKEAVTLKFKCGEATYARIKQALQTGTLVSAAFSAGTADPSTAVPTLTPAGTGGTLAAGVWKVSYAYRRTAGIGAAPGGSTKTYGTPGQATTTGSTSKITVGVGITPPGGYTVDWYLSDAPGSNTLKFYVNNSGGTFDITAAPGASAAAVPSANYTANPGSDMLQVGGKTFFSPQCVALVSDLGTFNNGGGDIPIFQWVALYEAMSVDGATVEWKRGETRMIEVTMTGYADITREEGDQLFQIGELEDPTP